MSNSQRERIVNQLKLLTETNPTTPNNSQLDRELDLVVQITELTGTKYILQKITFENNLKKAYEQWANNVSAIIPDTVNNSSRLTAQVLIIKAIAENAGFSGNIVFSQLESKLQLLKFIVDNGGLLSPCLTGLLAWNLLNNTYIAYDSKLRIDDKQGVRDEEVLQGKCYDFDAVSSINKSVLDFRSTDNAGAIFFEIKLNQTGQYSIFASAYEGSDVFFLIIQSYDEVLRVAVKNNDDTDLVVSDTTLNIGVYHKCIIVSTGSEYKFYIDGVETSKSTVVGLDQGRWFADIINRENFTVGVVKRLSESQHLNGKVGYLAISNTIPNVEEIANNRPYQENTVLQYYCNEEAENYAVDSSGYEEHGLIINATLIDFHATDNDFRNSYNDLGYGEVDTNNAKYPLDENDDLILPSGVSGVETKHIGRVKRSIEAITAGTTLFSEGFENGGAIPTGWTTELLTGATVDWDYQDGGNSGNPPFAHTGDYNAYLFRDQQADNPVSLITPVINLESSTNPKLKFWLAMIAFLSDIDEVYVEYRVDAVSPWIEIFSQTTEVSDWTEFELSLPNPSATYQISFKGVAKWGRGVCIDDVSISDESGPLTGVKFLDIPVMNLWNKLDTNVWGANFAGTPDSDKFKWTLAELQGMYDKIQQPYDKQLFVKEPVSGDLTEILTYDQILSGDCLDQTYEYVNDQVLRDENGTPLLDENDDIILID